MKAVRSLRSVMAPAMSFAVAVSCAAAFAAAIPVAAADPASPPPARSATPAPDALVPDAPAGTKLVVGTKVVKPFAFRTADGAWTGISIDLWEEIARSRNWQWEWREAPNTNALVEMVAKGEVDVGIAAITMKPARAELVDFSNSMYESGLGIAVRSRPASALGSLRTLASATFLRTLGGLFLLLVAMGTLMWLFERRKNAEQFEPDARRGLFSGLWWSAVTMTTVGYGDKAPRTLAGRLVALFWMYTSVVLISSFTAIVASTLTTRQITSTVRGPEDVPHVRVGAKTGEAPFDYLQGRGIRPVAFETLDDGLKALAADQIDAFVHDQPVLKYELVENADFDNVLQVLPDVMQEEEYGIAVTPTVPPYRNAVRDRINAALLELKTSGRFQEIEDRYLSRE